MSSSPIGVGILGAGNIAGPYARDIVTYPELRLVGVCDIDAARAQSFAAEHQVRAYASLDEMLADPEIAIVVNLTIHHAHKATTAQILNAGKHCFSEKPLALGAADAAELVALAAQKGVRLAAAPFTLLGEAQQLAWSYIRQGKLGTVRVVFADVNWGRIESWHPNPAPFYEVGPMQDVGVYPLTILVSILGPVRRVTASGHIVKPQRVTKDGASYDLTTPDIVLAVLEHASGAVTRLTADFYVSNQTTRQTGIEFHGDDGSLFLQSWFFANSPLFFGPFGEALTPVTLPASAVDGIRWGRGLLDLAHALRDDRPHRFSGELAAHVCEVLEAVKRAYQGGAPVAVTSSFVPPAPVE